MQQSETRKQLTKEKDIEVPVSSEEEQGTRAGSTNSAGPLGQGWSN